MLLRTLMMSLLILARLLTVEGSAPVLTIHSPDGDMVDCIRREEQHAFKHPLLRNHQIREFPTGMPYTTEIAEYGWQVWHGNGTRCPVGTVPVRNVSSDRANETPGLSAGQRATQGHEYAIGGTVEDLQVYGTQVTMNVWRPEIGGFNEFSLGQTWIISGSYEDNNLNSLEAGWQVYPYLYGDDVARFFTLWTTDAYNESPCYNLRCPGFVQTNPTIMLEGAINQISVWGGAQVDLTIRIWVDHTQGCWWLGVILAHGVLVPVGYWPTVILTRLRDHAEIVKWGGEIVNTNPLGRHTRTQMGSGFFPEGGFGKAAYMRNLEIALTENDFQPVQVFKIGSTFPDYYRSGVKKADRRDFGAHFYYGGPNPTPAIASQSSWDSVLAFVCFGVFWFI